MSCTKIIRAGLVWALIALSLAACARAAPTAAPTATVEVTATTRPTSTPRPTRTPVPTKTPVQPTEAVTPTTDATGNNAAGGNTAGGNTAGGNAAAASGAGPADKYVFLGQSIPDKTQVRPGTQLTIIWTIKNDGAAAWSTDYTMRYFSGIKASQDVYKFTKVVATDKTIDLMVTITAPSENGDYGTWWKLTNAQGKNFGDVDFSFTVTSNPTKATATPTK
jgi:hypothetical protein